MFKGAARDIDDIARVLIFLIKDKKGTSSTTIGSIQMAIKSTDDELSQCSVRLVVL